MPEHTISARTYVLICAILILLTFLTVGISFLELPGRWHFTLGMVIGAAKATLVVLFFMHVLISSRVTVMVILVSVFWLLLLVGLTLTDFMSRGMVPYMPGH